jgi:hypothetical protein
MALNTMILSITIRECHAQYNDTKQHNKLLVMTLSITLGTTTHNIAKLGIKTLDTMSLSISVRKCNTQHNDTQHNDTKQNNNKM